MVSKGLLALELLRKIEKDEYLTSSERDAFVSREEAAIFAMKRRQNDIVMLLRLLYAGMS